MPDLSQIKDQLDRIERAIVGDKEMGQVGLVDRMAAAESDIQTIKQERRDEANQKRGALWLVTTVSAVAGAAGAFIVWVVGFFNTAPKP